MSTTTGELYGARELGDDLRLRRLGYSVVAIVFVGFGGWAAIAPIEGAALAPGMITVQNSRKTIQHLEGGIVRALPVVDGQWVSQGDLLLEIEGRQFRAELDALRVQHATLEAMFVRLIAERDGRDALQFPETATLAPDDARLIEARAAQRASFTTRRKAHDGEIAVLRQTVEQLRAQMAGISSVMASKRRVIQSYESEIDDLRELLKEGFADRQKLREYERNVDSLTAELADLESTLAATGAKIGETELRILQVRRDFQAAVAAELGETQVKLSDVAERLNAAGDRVTRTLVRAPVTGRVLNLKVHTIGGVVGPGEPILDIVPDHDELVVEGRLSPYDIDRVRSGLDATVRMSGLRRENASRLRGKVVTVSADRLVDERTGASYYSAQVAIDATERDRLGDVDLQPGMPADVMINTGSRTLFGYLWDPIGSAIEQSFRED